MIPDPSPVGVGTVARPSEVCVTVTSVVCQARAHGLTPLPPCPNRGRSASGDRDLSRLAGSACCSQTVGALSPCPRPLASQTHAHARWSHHSCPPATTASRRSPPHPLRPAIPAGRHSFALFPHPFPAPQFIQQFTPHIHTDSHAHTHAHTHTHRTRHPRFDFTTFNFTLHHHSTPQQHTRSRARQRQRQRQRHPTFDAWSRGC
ncbi:hypothetical protein CALCODRAFT_125979 [Calocera cornea HHB12733]|uniref:Uncharacterized protein n=1 Tax=Calocera cornea HHB12733 TaxID=1353952 RepID=A0A165CWN6_9BASI|nr:hypothetical protein CALCODRAFT_125979 [Calocera cornea HHB12733]